MMSRAIVTCLVVAVTVVAAFNFSPQDARAGQPGQPTDWHRYYYYPYVYYPHNFQQPQTFNHMYHRYPRERQIPIMNNNWHNFYPSERPFHKGNHFKLSIF